MSLTNEQKQAALGEYLKTASGRQKLAAAITQPLRQRRDYMSVARKAFQVEQLPDGALPIYDKDPDVTAYVVGEEGESIVSVSKSRRVIFPLYEIAANPEIPLTQIKERRFDIIERTQDLARVQVQAAEDSRAFDIFDAVAAEGFDNVGAVNPVVNVAAPLTTANLGEAVAEIEKWDLRVARIFVNARDYNDIRKWGREELDEETQQTLLRTGLMATIWGAQIIQTRMVPVGTMYVLAEPEFLARMPVRTELTVISADDPKARRIGFSVFENIGQGVYNPLGLVKINLVR